MIIHQIRSRLRKVRSMQIWSYVLLKEQFTTGKAINGNIIPLSLLSNLRNIHTWQTDINELDQIQSVWTTSFKQLGW